MTVWGWGGRRWFPRAWCRTVPLRACAKPCCAQPTPGAVTAGLRLGFGCKLNLTPEMTMTNARMALLELIEKSADTDLVREMLAFGAERLMERICCKFARRVRIG